MRLKTSAALEVSAVPESKAAASVVLMIGLSILVPMDVCRWNRPWRLRSGLDDDQMTMDQDGPMAVDNQRKRGQLSRERRPAGRYVPRRVKRDNDVMNA